MIILNLHVHCCLLRNCGYDSGFYSSISDSLSLHQERSNFLVFAIVSVIIVAIRRYAQ